VAEAACVGFPHPLKGQGVYAYVVLREGAAADAGLTDRLNAALRREIGAHARVDALQVAPGLPKTRSGKVMRRILRKIAEGETEGFGDVSTLAEPGVVGVLVAGRVRV
jgi:acetyl-CoA synthetase